MAFKVWSVPQLSLKGRLEAHSPRHFNRIVGLGQCLTMRKKRQTVTTTVTHEVMSIRRRGKVMLWCEECAAQVRMVTPEEAALLAGVSARAIYRRIEAGRLHFTETTEGLLLICFNSLLKA
jgi:hypothetical protein